MRVLRMNKVEMYISDFANHKILDVAIIGNIFLRIKLNIGIQHIGLIPGFLFGTGVSLAKEKFQSQGSWSNVWILDVNSMSCDAGGSALGGGEGSVFSVPAAVTGLR